MLNQAKPVTEETSLTESATYGRGAIVHEWVAKRGGSENVFEAMLEAFPSAWRFVLWNDDKERFPGVPESWLAQTPLRRHKALALPAMIPTWRNIRAAGEVDWVMASSHLFAHHAHLIGRTSLPKLVYAHTPARYLWVPELDDRGSTLAARLASPLLCKLDRMRALEAASIAANSQFTKERIQATWHREAKVIYPPVEVRAIQAVQSWSSIVSPMDQLALDALPSGFILGASRFVAYKRLELAIRAGEAARMPVVIAGSGPEEQALRRLAGNASVPVHFVVSPSEFLLRALYERAAVFVFAAVEDFGIMPVEAMAVGTPVVTGGLGGTSESVIDGVTGAAMETERPRQLREAVQRALDCDPDTIRARARMFERERFLDQVQAWVAETVQAPLAERRPPNG